MVPVLNLILCCLVLASAVAYENAYDLIERRNRKLYDPRIFHSASDRSPYPHFSAFGNGYDNLGNGIPVRRTHPFRQQFMNGWRFERRPFRERAFEGFDYVDYSQLAPPRDFVGHRRNGYYPALHRNFPSPGGAYGNEFRREGAEVERFFEENEGKKQKKTDEVYQSSQEGAKMDSLRKEKSGEELRSDQMGENKSSLRSNKVVKKGRTTKGFAVHHHKDETGNSTTYFDESSDFGGQSDLRDFADGFGTKKTLEQVVDKGDEKYFKESGGQTGNYGSGLLVGNERFHKDFSSAGGREESGGKYHGEGDDEGFGRRKSYQYLNGEPFAYAEREVVNYY